MVKRNMMQQAIFGKENGECQLKRRWKNYALNARGLGLN